MSGMHIATTAVFILFGIGPVVALMIMLGRVKRTTFLKGIIAACISALVTIYGIMGLALYAQPNQPLLPGIFLAAIMTFHFGTTVRATLRDLRAARQEAAAAATAATEAKPVA